MSEEIKNQQPDANETEQTEQPEQQPVRRPLTEKERQIRQRQRDLEYLKRKQMIREAENSEERARVYDSIHYNHIEAKPDTAIKKWENFWYHYKFTTIVIVIVVALVTWFVYDMVTNTRYDLSMGLVTYNTYNNDYETLPQNWAKYLDDNTGDRKVNITLMAVEYDMEEAQKDQSSISYDEIMVDTTHMSVMFLQDSTYFVLILDQNYYEYYTEKGIQFVDLSTLVENDAVVGDKYFIANDPDFAEFDGKDDCFLVLRDTATVAGWEKAGDKVKNAYDVSQQFLIDLINKNVHESALKETE